MESLWFDQFELGMTFETVGRTITEADVVNFAGVSGDFHVLHTDAELMRDSHFGQRIVHGALVLSIVTGLRSRLGVFDDSLLAFAEIRSWRFLAPVFIGDTINASNTVVDMRKTSKPDRGVVVQRVEVRTQRGDVVQSGEVVMLLRCKTAASGLTH